MKKLDTTKPAIYESMGAYRPASFVREFKIGGRHGRFLWFSYNDLSGEEWAHWVDEYGIDSNNQQIIKNVPETITFWVPVWQLRGEKNLRLFSPKISEEKPQPMNPGEDFIFIGWKGPFTITVDD